MFILHDNSTKLAVRNCLLFLLSFVPLLSTSQILHLPELRAPLQTTTYSKHQSEALCFTFNQAALALFKKPAFAIYGEKRFMLDDLAFFAASVVLPTTSGNFGLSVRRFGSSDYNEMETGLAYGLKLGDKAAIGTQFNYRSFKTNGYGKAGVLSVDAAAIFQLSNELRAGFHVYKPAGSIREKDGEIKLPSVYEVGFGYDASDHLFISAIANKVEGMGLQAAAAVQYAFSKYLVCKTGVSSGSSLFYFGAGVELKDLRVDAVASYHQNLGLTPGLQLLYHLPD